MKYLFADEWECLWTVLVYSITLAGIFNLAAVSSANKLCVKSGHEIKYQHNGYVCSPKGVVNVSR